MQCLGHYDRDKCTVHFIHSFHSNKTFFLVHHCMHKYIHLICISVIVYCITYHV